MINSQCEIEVITLFVDELAAARDFYVKIFGSKIINEDDVSSLIKFGRLMINLLQVSEAPELIEPMVPSTPKAGVTALLTIKVGNVDAMCAELARHGVSLLNGPIDRPWGRRTAAFADPSGHAWEIAQELAPT